MSGAYHFSDCANVCVGCVAKQIFGGVSKIGIHAHRTPPAHKPPTKQAACSSSNINAPSSNPVIQLLSIAHPLDLIAHSCERVSKRRNLKAVSGDCVVSFQKRNTVGKPLLNDAQIFD
jgi:hypothetical protein